MRARYDLYNVVGLVIAGLLGAGVLNNVLNVEHRVFILLFVLALGTAIGVGSLINLSSRGLLYGPTRAMITGYCFSVAFLPLALWGYILLRQANLKPSKHRRGRHHRHHENSPFSHF